MFTSVGEIFATMAFLNTIGQIVRTVLDLLKQKGETSRGKKSGSESAQPLTSIVNVTINKFVFAFPESQRQANVTLFIEFIAERQKVIEGFARKYTDDKHLGLEVLNYFARESPKLAEQLGLALPRSVSEEKGPRERLFDDE